MSLGTVGSSTVYQYRFLQLSEQRVQSWYKWTLTGTLLDQFFDQSTYYAVVANGTKVDVQSYNLRQSSDEGFLTLPTGEKTDVFLDYWSINPYRTYNSGTDTTRVFLPYDIVTGKTFVVVALGGYIGGSNVTSSQSVGAVLSPTVAGSTGAYYAERIDANLLNIDIADLNSISKKDYDRKFSALKVNTHGKLIIKEYPTAAASALHFRALLNELQLKKSFKPDIIFIDYLNICASARIKPGANVNSYSYIKAIAEELRGLAVEFDVPIVSATQTTRSGYTSSDPGLEDTSESFGLPATADFMFALISTEELQQLNQIMVKQLKNRYNDPNYFKRFVVGIDRAKMKLYDVEQGAQDDLADSGQVPPDKPLNTFGERERTSGFKNKFDGFKI